MPPAASMTYSTAQNRSQAMRLGPAPFAQFNQRGQDAFYGVKGVDIVQAVTVNAMRMAGASIGLVTMSETKPKQYQTKSGGWLKKTITTHVDGMTKPIWYVTTPFNL